MAKKKKSIDRGDYTFYDNFAGTKNYGVCVNVMNTCIGIIPKTSVTDIERMTDEEYQEWLEKNDL